MFRKFSTKELAVIAFLLEEEDENYRDANPIRKRRFAVHPMNVKRKWEGEFYTLYKELQDDEERFVKYFRMSSLEFNSILAKISHLITRQNTKFKESLTPKEKLAVCLR